jgi:hypothetical protein
MFRFTIRDVLWLTVVVALGLGWWADRARLDAPLAKLAEYERAGQIALKRKQDGKRLRDLQWKLSSFQSVRKNGAPWPAGEKPTFTGKEMEEMMELSERLAREKPE